MTRTRRETRRLRMLAIGKRSLSITVFQGNLGSSIHRRASGTRGLAVEKMNHCGNGCGRTVHGSISLQKNHPHPRFARIGLVARIGLAPLGSGWARRGLPLFVARWRRKRRPLHPPAQLRVRRVKARHSSKPGVSAISRPENLVWPAGARG